MKVKNVLAWTNPLAWFVGVPVVVGIGIACMCNNLFKNTGKIVKETIDDLE